MPAGEAQRRQREAISERLLWFVEKQWGSYSSFARKHPGLASAAHNWLPATEAAGAKARRSKRALPRADSLRDFCGATGASADYILFGVGPKYRGQSKKTSDLFTELRKAVALGALQRLAEDPTGRALAHAANEVDPSGIIDDASAQLAERLPAIRRAGDRSAARLRVDRHEIEGARYTLWAYVEGHPDAERCLADVLERAKGTSFQNAAIRRITGTIRYLAEALDAKAGENNGGTQPESDETEGE